MFFEIPAIGRQYLHASYSHFSPGRRITSCIYLAGRFGWGGCYPDTGVSLALPARQKQIKRRKRLNKAEFAIRQKEQRPSGRFFLSGAECLLPPWLQNKQINPVDNYPCREGLPSFSQILYRTSPFVLVRDNYGHTQDTRT